MIFVIEKFFRKINEELYHYLLFCCSVAIYSNLGQVIIKIQFICATMLKFEQTPTIRISIYQKALCFLHIYLALPTKHNH